MSCAALRNGCRLAIRLHARPFSTSGRCPVNLNDRCNDTAELYRKFQLEKPLNPHITNTTSTITNEMPSVGAGSAPAELLTNADPKFTPVDSDPANTKHMTGGTQDSGKKEYDVGELEGGSFRVEPLRRTGEDMETMRARLLYQCRKRGTLESDLLLSTFADAQLTSMSREMLEQFDRFLDENDWDIYYWATQQPSPTAVEAAEGTVSSKDEHVRHHSGEWAQTVGTFKAAFRPVPSRWRDSELLSMLRKHVVDRSSKGAQFGASDNSGKGMGFMPRLNTA
ncbi:SDH assembly factor 2 [Piedraia hortae CBS 480.64]|uniref:Succinate dehydrogenase assembly factor 2, mitochondrial n=1 Tax=Piedraia hortae CBS 480.64 TaxID=1314780 RepID=A0A6A7C625_9PEZI|nr:SDH assembly factor 2 [Piedraia hortae CBS 480.64]